MLTRVHSVYLRLLCRFVSVSFRFTVSIPGFITCHGNTFQQPHHAFTCTDLRHIVTFLTNFAEANAILLPGRIPGYKRDDVELLPTQLTKKKVWDYYINSCATQTYKLASYRSFCHVWQRYKPYIIITRPKSDLCFTCQSNSMAITMSANKSENDKLKVKISYQ